MMWYKICIFLKKTEKKHKYTKKVQKTEKKTGFAIKTASVGFGGDPSDPHAPTINMLS